MGLKPPGLKPPGLKPPGLSLRGRALAALAQREHSRTELRRKLMAALQRADRNARLAALAQADGPEAPEPPDRTEQLASHATQVDTLLDALTNEGWLSETRFIDSRLRTRAPRLGARRLQAELGQHGLAPSGEVWDEVQATEPERAQALLQRRFGDAPPPDDKERARRIRFLISRGFSTELALRLTSDKRRSA
jgi:regulatory protein